MNYLFYKRIIIRENQIDANLLLIILINPFFFSILQLTRIFIKDNIIKFY